MTLEYILTQVKRDVGGLRDTRGQYAILGMGEHNPVNVKIDHPVI